MTRPAIPPRTLALAGSVRLRPVAEAAAAAYAEQAGWPSLDLRGSASGIHALSAGVADAALLDRRAWESERRPFHQIMGSEPAVLRVGIMRLEPGRAPPAPYVHAANPLGRISLDQAARVLTLGAGKGDIVLWGQLGLSGDGAERRIHVYGERDDGGFATNLRLDLLGKRQFAPAYEALDGPEAVVSAVRDDRFGFALLDEADEAALAGIKRLALTAPRRVGGQVVVDDPLAPAVRLAFVRPTRDRPNAEAIRFARFMLSPAGQRAIAGAAEPLAELDAADQRAALERIADASD